MPDVDAAWVVQIDRRDGRKLLWTGPDARRLPFFEPAAGDVLERMSGILNRPDLRPGEGSASPRPRGLAWFGGELVVAGSAAQGARTAAFAISTPCFELGERDRRGGDGQDCTRWLARLGDGSEHARTAFVAAGRAFCGLGDGRVFEVAPGAPGAARLHGRVVVTGQLESAETVGETTWFFDRAPGGDRWRSMATADFLALAGATRAPAAGPASAVTYRGTAPAGPGALWALAARGADVAIDRIEFEAAGGGAWRARAVEALRVRPELDNASGFRSLAFDPTRGWLWTSDRERLYRVVVAGTLVSLGLTRPGLGTVAPGATAVGGSGAWTFEVPGAGPEWLEPQGPVRCVLRLAMRAADGDWRMHPLASEGVLDGCTVSGGVARCTVKPLMASALHQAAGSQWSAAEQLRRTGGADAALARLEGGARPLVYPAHV